jgi:type IV secretory pathway VirB3-like protein
MMSENETAIGYISLISVLLIMIVVVISNNIIANKKAVYYQTGLMCKNEHNKTRILLTKENSTIVDNIILYKNDSYKVGTDCISEI